MAEALTDTGEALATLGSGMAAQVPGGIAGLVEYFRQLGHARALGRSRDEARDLARERAGGRTREVSEAFTFEPRSAAGRERVAKIGQGIETLGEQAMSVPGVGPTVRGWQDFSASSPLLAAGLLGATEVVGPGKGKPKLPKPKLGADLPQIAPHLPEQLPPPMVPEMPQVPQVPPEKLPMLGQFPTTTAGRIINETKKGGGYSVNLPSGEIPTEGLMMGKFRNTDPRNLVTDALTRAKLAEHARQNRGVLSREDAYLGTWRDPESGKTYVDVSKRFPPEEVRQATKYGERSGQIAGCDVGKKAQFPVGNWEEFVNSPEFQGRLGEMEGVGRSYLSQHPAKEWWDMHGGAFERVYGQENLPEVAGLLAATAPVVNPRQNLQKASEYLRRHIKGEPTIQPEWRMPEGMMNWQPGKKMGMENAFAKNLEHAAAGRLDQLQANKVREEAQALMGDPNAVVLDRHWARLAEDPSRGIFTAATEGVVESGKQYDVLKSPIIKAAQARGRDVRDFSADVWTGIRETIKNKGELYGRKFQKGKIQGESKSYADQFEDLISEKAKHLGITEVEMESRLRSGDATLLAWLAASPILAPVLAEVLGEQNEGGT